MKPGERIRLITEAADLLNRKPVPTIQLILRSHGLRTFDFESEQYGPGQLSYVMGQIEDAPDDTLVGLHSYLVGEEATPARLPSGSADTAAGNPVSVFLSHRHEDAAWVGKLRDILGTRYGIDGFVAHADISPSVAWRQAIRTALSSCDLLVAVMHEKFHDSQWCDQEVGWALGRNIPVVPVRREPVHGPRVDGFLEEHQDLIVDPRRGSSEFWVAEQIFKTVVTDARTRRKGVAALAEAFVSSMSFSSTRMLWDLLKDVDKLGQNEIRRLRLAVKTNNQVYEAVSDGRRIPDLVEEFLVKFDPPMTDAGPF